MAPIFLATFQSGQSQVLIDNNKDLVYTHIPSKSYFYQMLVCGKTGSGKTVALKYLAQHFVEEVGGAVLAINVKEQDFLYMNQPSNLQNSSINREWDVIGNKSKVLVNNIIYYPGTNSEPPHGIDAPSERICLDVRTIDPDALTGLLLNLTQLGAQSLPDIFRFWRDEYDEKSANYTFNEFVQYFANARNADTPFWFQTINEVGQRTDYVLNPGVFGSIERNLISAQKYFDLEGAVNIDESHILQEGQLSVIDVVGNYDFGSVLLRNLLHSIDRAKSLDPEKKKIPILIIIDEVTNFTPQSSKEALGFLEMLQKLEK